MTRQQERKGTKSRAERHRPSARRNGFRGLIVVTALILALIGLTAATLFLRRQTLAADRHLDQAVSGPPLPAQSQSDGIRTDLDLSAVVNQLFASVNPSLPENQYFPQFAKDKLFWIIAEQKAHRLSIILLKNTDNTNLDFEAIMASGIADGKPTIVIAGQRFLGFLIEGGRTSAPFTLQERNDFALGLVHEAVHLEKENTANPAILEERLNEELRTWLKVDVDVVRQLRRLNQPMNPRLIEADDALRICRDKLPCEPLKQILLPSEIRR